MDIWVTRITDLRTKFVLSGRFLRNSHKRTRSLIVRAAHPGMEHGTNMSIRLKHIRNGRLCVCACVLAKRIDNNISTKNTDWIQWLLQYALVAGRIEGEMLENYARDSLGDLQKS